MKVHNRQDMLDLRRGQRNEPSRAEKLLWYSLRGSKVRGAKFRRQHSVGRYILDFYCPDYRLAIELDGEYHDSAERKLNDAARTIALKAMGIQIVRFANDEVFSNTADVVRRIEAVLSTLPHGPHHPPTPSSSEEGE